MVAGAASPSSPLPASGAPALLAAGASAPPAEVRAASGELLRGWWQQFDDPLLAELIDSAQGASSTLAQAALRIAQARQAPEGFLDQLGAWLEALRAGASDDADVKQRLAVFVPEYSPQGLHPVGPGRTEHAGNAR